MTHYEIVDWELDSVVATIGADGEYEHETELARAALDSALDEGGVIMDPRATEPEGGGSATFEEPVAPGDDDYVGALSGALPSPLEVEPVESESLAEKASRLLPTGRNY